MPFKLIAGRYILEGSACEDTPYHAILSFVHAIDQGRTDLAKAWLIDSSLVSIPKYIGLGTKPAATPSRIIRMVSPAATSYRYRLVTFGRYDLICDVIKTKRQWAIKALFIAAADPVLQKIARNLQPAQGQQSPTARSSEGDSSTEAAPKNKGKTSSATAAPGNSENRSDTTDAQAPPTGER